MNINREYNGKTFTTELTQDELYKAHREYVCEAYVEDVKTFLDIVEVPEEKLEAKHLKGLAKLFYDIKLGGEYTDDYAMARAVIPFLRDMKIKCSYQISDFDSTSYLNCA